MAFLNCFLKCNFNILIFGELKMKKYIFTTLFTVAILTSIISNAVYVSHHFFSKETKTHTKTATMLKKLKQNASKYIILESCTKWDATWNVFDRKKKIRYTLQYNAGEGLFPRQVKTVKTYLDETVGIIKNIYFIAIDTNHTWHIFDLKQNQWEIQLDANPIDRSFLLSEKLYIDYKDKSRNIFSFYPQPSYYCDANKATPAEKAHYPWLFSKREYKSLGSISQKFLFINHDDKKEMLDLQNGNKPEFISPKKQNAPKKETIDRSFYIFDGLPQMLEGAPAGKEDRFKITIGLGAHKQSITEFGIPKILFDLM